TPSSELLDEIHDGDYVEIYDSSGVQVFANFEFCAMITYSIEEVTCRHWTELYERDEKHTSQIMAEFTKAFTTATGPFTPNIDVHITKERENPTNSAHVTMKKFAPLFNKNGQ